MAKYRGRRIPLPWRIVDSGYSFSIEDAEGKKLAIIFCRTGGGGDSPIFVKDLTFREAQLIARNIVKLPALLKSRQSGAGAGDQNLSGGPRDRRFD